MALSRIWYTIADYQTPQGDGSDSQIRRGIAWAFKAMLTGQLTGINGVSGPPPVGSRWTVEGSGDGTTFGMDGVDRWGSTYNPATLPWGTNSNATRPWIVLKAPTALGPRYICIYLWTNSTTATEYSWYLIVSTTPFTGGANNARPTSTTEQAISGNSTSTQFTDNTVMTGVWRLNYVTDAAGHFAAILVKQGGGVSAARTLFAYWPFSGFDGDQCTDAFIFVNGVGATNALKMANGWTTNAAWGRSQNNAANVVFSVLNYAHNVSNSVTENIPGVNPFTGKWDEFPLVLYCYTANYLALRGTLIDMGFVPAAAPNMGTSPPSGGIERVNFQGLLLPFGVVPTT